MKRIFCAVKVPVNAAIDGVMGAFTHELSHAAITWVSLQNPHLTLKFFGETPNHRIKDIVDALQTSAGNTVPFGFTVKGCGTFGSIRYPKVIWLGISNGKGLESLYHTINRFLKPLGIEPDRKLFTPHLTIGRIRDIRDTATLRKLESEFYEQEFAKVHIGSFFLMESILRPQGPLYKVINEFILGEGHRA